VGILLDIPMELAGGHRCWSDAEHDPRATGETLEALGCFKSMLGDPWDGWQRGAPLARSFFTPFQGREPEGVKLYRMIRWLDGARGLGDEVVECLAREAWDEYVAATMALEFGSRIRAAGGDAEFVQRDNTSTPDVRVKPVERWVAIELKALHERDEMRPWRDFEQKLIRGLGARGLLRGDLAFDYELTQAARTDAEAVIEGVAAVAAGNYREFHDLPRGTGRARIAAINVGSCGYPITQYDELVRIETKLREKWWKKFRSSDGPTLLIVRTTHVFGSTAPASVGAVARRIANVLAPRLRASPKIGGVLVYDEPFLPPVWPLFADAGDVRVRMDTSAGCARQMALVPNPAAAVPLTEHELSRFVGPEIMW
jgi:hypothetical protein